MIVARLFISRKHRNFSDTQTRAVCETQTTQEAAQRSTLGTPTHTTGNAARRSVFYAALKNALGVLRNKARQPHNSETRSTNPPHAYTQFLGGRVLAETLQSSLLRCGIFAAKKLSEYRHHTDLWCGRFAAQKHAPALEKCGSRACHRRVAQPPQKTHYLSDENRHHAPHVASVCHCATGPAWHSGTTIRWAVAQLCHTVIANLNAV